MAATILETIAAYAKERAARDKEKVPEKEMRERALTLPKGTFRFSRALRKKEMSFICEVKKASPSKGLIDLSVVKHISNRIGVMYLGRMVELADSYELTMHSLHPYTKSLISAIPIADPKQARASKRIALEGDVPSPLNPPSGCRFRTRCPYADEQCAKEVPEFKEVAPGHYAACHHLDKCN